MLFHWKDAQSAHVIYFKGDGIMRKSVGVLLLGVLVLLMLMLMLSALSMVRVWYVEDEGYIISGDLAEIDADKYLRIMPYNSGTQVNFCG